MEGPFKDHMVIELLTYRRWTKMFLDFDWTLFLQLFVFQSFYFSLAERAKVTQ